MQQKVFIAGATGVIGRRVIPELVARGHHVAAVGVVLRFALFYGPDAAHVPPMVSLVRHGWAPLPGSPDAGARNVLMHSAHFRLRHRRAYALAWHRETPRSALMPLSGKLALGLSEKLGEEVASGLINAFNEMEASHRSEYQGLRQDIAKLETRLVEVKAELRQDLARLEQKLAGVQSELIKWVFVFWLGTVGIVMALLRYFSVGAPTS
jgi:hypothetical protein